MSVPPLLLWAPFAGLAVLAIFLLVDVTGAWKLLDWIGNKLDGIER